MVNHQTLISFEGLETNAFPVFSGLQKQTERDFRCGVKWKIQNARVGAVKMKV